ncbi:MAG: T9SS type A sorting domain-containing protein [Bacteroidota bacterium]
MKNKKTFTNSNAIQSFLGSLLFAFLLMLNSFNGFSQCLPPASVTTINGVTGACPGQTKSFTITAVPTATSYTWTLPAGCSINGLNPYTGAGTSVSVVFGGTFSPPGNISIKANNACGSSASTSKTISTAYPSLSGISGASKGCPGDVTDYHVTNESGVTYTWTPPAGMTINSGQGTNGIIVTFQAGFVGGTMSVAGNYGCGNGSARTATITKSNPVTPSVITGSDDACPNSTKSYSITPRSGETYTWTAPPGGSVTSGQGTPTASITFPAVFSSGYVSVTSQNACGTSVARTMIVHATPPTPGGITGTKSGLCNSTQTYSVDAVTTAITYNWTGPVGSTILSGQGTTSINIAFPSSVSGYVTVSVSNDCGTGAQAKLSVTGDIIIRTHPQGMTVCQDDNSTMTIDVPGSGLSYQWRKDGVNLSDNADFSGTQTSSVNVLGVDSLNEGFYDVVVTSSCASSVTSSYASFKVNMKPPAPGTVTKPAFACPGTSGALSVPGAGYNTTGNFWSNLNTNTSFTSGQGTNSVNVDYGTISQSGYSFAVYGVNGCGRSHDSTTTWIRRSISTPTIAGSKYVCPNQTNVDYAASNSGQISTTWTTSTPNIIITGGQGTRNVTLSFAAGFTQGFLYLTASNPCMTTPVRDFHIYKNTGCRMGDENTSASSAATIELAAYPNPASDKVNLTFNIPTKNSFTISVTDIYGKNVLSEQIIAEEGDNKIPLDLKNISSGMYSVSLKSSDMLYQTKIMVQK